MGIFREYDIRGIVEQELLPSVVERIGQAYATLARDRGVRTVAVGRDGRLSSPMLHEALLKGLTSSGLNVLDIGVCATPLLYFSLFHCDVQGGIMITGSHNAAEYNGFKMCVGTEALYGQDIQALQALYEKGVFSSGHGTIESFSIIPEYLEFLGKHFGTVEGKIPHVVVDCGNGAASLMATQALEQLGCRVTKLYCDLDGTFPNHHPDPTVEENMADLIHAVGESGADLGIGYDGDADRIGVIDEKGQILWGDRLLLLFARDVLADHPGCTFISEVKASQVLYDDIHKRGGRAVMWKTGHSIIKAKMKEEKALLAGEMSGHVFFADRYFGYDDAIYASCRLIEILAKTSSPLSVLLSDVPQTMVTPEIRVDCPDDQKFHVVKDVAQQFQSLFAGNGKEPTSQNSVDLSIRNIITIDGIRVIFKEGWGLIRASNTQPALVLRFEANSEPALLAIRTFMEEQLRMVQSRLITEESLSS